MSLQPFINAVKKTYALVPASAVNEAGVYVKENPSIFGKEIASFFADVVLPASAFGQAREFLYSNGYDRSKLNKEIFKQVWKTPEERIKICLHFFPIFISRGNMTEEEEEEFFQGPSFASKTSFDLDDLIGELFSGQEIQPPVRVLIACFDVEISVDTAEMFLSSIFEQLEGVLLCYLKQYSPSNCAKFDRHLYTLARVEMYSSPDRLPKDRRTLAQLYKEFPTLMNPTLEFETLTKLVPIREFANLLDIVYILIQRYKEEYQRLIGDFDDPKTKSQREVVRLFNKFEKNLVSFGATIHDDISVPIAELAQSQFFPLPRLLGGPGESF